MLVNHKRVVRLMRADNLLAVQPRAFVVTTDSQHDLEVYLNLASRLTLTGMNQLWVADITYIRLQEEFVYLAVILDAYSRKVVGWALDRTLANRLPIAALALGHRRAAAAARSGPSFRSRRPVCLRRTYDYCCDAPDDPEHEPPANPYDNASCESFMKTLKHEEVYARYLEISEPRRIGVFIEQYYNTYGCIRRWATTHRKNSRTRLVR